MGKLITNGLVYLLSKTKKIKMKWIDRNTILIQNLNYSFVSSFKFSDIYNEYLSSNMQKEAI